MASRRPIVRPPTGGEEVLQDGDTLQVPTLKVSGLPSAAALGTDADGNVVAKSAAGGAPLWKQAFWGNL